MAENAICKARYESRTGRICCDAQSFHGILIIGDNEHNTARYNIDRKFEPAYLSLAQGDAKHRVSTRNKFGPQTKNLGSIIRGFKSSVTTYARTNDIGFDWQPRFHEHIITTEKEY